MPLDGKSSKTLTCESESNYETGHARKASGTNHSEGGPGANLLYWPGSIPTALWSEFPCLTYAKAASQGLAPSSFLLRELRLASCLRPYFLTF